MTDWQSEKELWTAKNIISSPSFSKQHSVAKHQTMEMFWTLFHEMFVRIVCFTSREVPCTAGWIRWIPCDEAVWGQTVYSFFKTCKNLSPLFLLNKWTCLTLHVEVPTITDINGSWCFQQKSQQSVLSELYRKQFLLESFEWKETQFVAMLIFSGNITWYSKNVIWL